MRVACMQVALHAPIAGMAGLALGLDFSKKLLQYATTALWHTAKVPLTCCAGYCVVVLCFNVVMVKEPVVVEQSAMEKALDSNLAWL